jgi:hypothetical protein
MPHSVSVPRGADDLAVLLVEGHAVAVAGVGAAQQEVRLGDPRHRLEGVPDESEVADSRRTTGRTTVEAAGGVHREVVDGTDDVLRGGVGAAGGSSVVCEGRGGERECCETDHETGDELLHGYNLSLVPLLALLRWGSCKACVGGRSLSLQVSTYEKYALTCSELLSKLLRCTDLGYNSPKLVITLYHTICIMSTISLK